ncbi:hypothetical protein [Aquimarina aquimarini]|uniref:hypothetical protein n=1 Tax=Aquimarina aquimarini TaxID=1191734 RepID=UPI000D55CB08|nr:hypothetical protein [Aquimarina aquimarini]
MKKIIVMFLLLGTIISCSSGDDAQPNGGSGNESRSSEKEILSVKFVVEGEEHKATLRNDSIIYKFPSGADITNLTPVIEISEKATINPASGITLDFTYSLIFEVTAEDNTSKEYYAVITKENSDTNIYYHSFNNLAPGSSRYDLINKVKEDQDTIIHYVPYASPIEALETVIVIDDKATIVPASGETLDFTNPVKHIVTADDGSKQEYLVFVELVLPQLSLPSDIEDTFSGKEKGALVTFNVNEINPHKDSIKVNIKNDERSYGLLVNSIDVDQKTITVQLPDEYINDYYKVEVFIEHDNFDVSSNFVLDKGTPKFRQVNSVYALGASNPVRELLIPDQIFSVSAIIDKSRYADHNFYLRKNGVEYPLIRKTMSNNSDSFSLQMPDLMTDIAIAGTGHEFVIELDGVKTVYDFLNNEGNSITITKGEAPVVTGIRENELFVNSTSITLTGQNLYFDYISFSRVQIELINGRGDVVFNTTTSYTNYVNTTEMRFGIHRSIKPGTYRIRYKGNVEAFGWIDTGVDVTVKLPPNQHPTLNVSEATLYSDTSAVFPRQVRVAFNENIASYTIKKIVLLGSSPEQEIGSFFTYPTSVLTGEISGYFQVFSNRTGYVLVEDNGVEYEIYFTLTVQR